MENKIRKYIIRHISKARKPVTILFTDIEGSTGYWDSQGDIKGRLMVDQHNRIVFPAIKKNQGKIIKTIGDAVMASFKSPEKALKAAISIQQLLEDAREHKRSFKLKVRIGIHTGNAIVEDQDIFGDAVNIAARIESKAKGNQILLSANTARKLNKQDYKLVKKGSFVPKGKKKEITLYKCSWDQYDDLTKTVKIDRFISALTSRQKLELVFFLMVNIVIIYFLYLKYFRYLLSDTESLALLFLNPEQLLYHYPILWVSLLTGFILVLWMIFRVKTVSLMTMSTLKGGVAFSIGFLIFYSTEMYLAPYMPMKWSDKLYESKHLFVEVLEDNVPVYQLASTHSKKISLQAKGTLLLLNDVSRKRTATWNKVLIKKNEYGWIARMKASVRVTHTDKFYFRYKDLYAVIFGLLCFVFGFRNFRLKPT